jgi:hypothetical protein
MLTKKVLAIAVVALVVVGSGVTVQLPQASASSHIFSIASAQAGTLPARYTSMTDIARSFDGKSKVYVAGKPFVGNAEIEAFQKLTEKHDNLFVFLVENEADLERVKKQLSDSVFNHPAFEGMVNPVLGEKDGMAILYVKNSNLGAKSYLMTEALQRRLDVGEPSFSGGNLGQVYQGAKAQGKNIPGRFTAVLDEIERVVSAEERSVVSSSSAAIADAKASITAVQQQASQFAKANQVKGAISEPPVAKWQTLIAQAETALKNKQFVQASKVAQGVSSETQAFSEALGVFSDGAARLKELEAQIATSENEIKDWSASDTTNAISSDLAAARLKLKDAKAAFSAGELSFSTRVREAESLVFSASSAVNDAKAAQSRSAALLYSVLLMAFGASATAGFFANRSARAARKRAFELYENAKNESTLLVEGADAFATEVKFLTLVSSTDPLVKQIQNHMSNVVSSINGFERVFREVRNLIEPNGIANRLTVGSYKQAIAYLEDADATISFDPYDLPEYLQADGLKAWATYSAKGALGESLQLSLGQLVDKARSEFASAQAGLAEYQRQSQEANEAIAELPAQLVELGKRVKALGVNAPFALPVIATTVIPSVIDPDKLLAKGKAALEATPTVAWSEYLEPAVELTAQADKAVTIAEYGQGGLAVSYGAVKDSLGNDGLEVKWVETKFTESSSKLSSIAGGLGADTSLVELETLHRGMLEVQAGFDKAVELNAARKGELPTAITNALKQFGEHQKLLAAVLQKEGRFQNGDALSLMSERVDAFSSRLSMSEAIQDCNARVDELGSLLSNGFVDKAEKCAASIAERLKVVFSLGAEAIAFATGFSGNASAQITKAEAKAKVEAGLIAFLEQRYLPTAIDLASPGESLQASSANCKGHLGLFATELSGAKEGLGAGMVLDSQSRYAKALSSLDEAQKCIVKIEATKQTLASKEQEVARKTAEVQRALDAVKARSNAAYIRSEAKRAISGLSSQVSRAQAGKLNPYGELDSLQRLERTILSAKTLADNDQRAYEAMQAARDEAKREISSTERKLSSAANMSFMYATVHLGSSRSEFSGAESYLSGGDRLARDGNYEEATRRYRDAERAAESAYSMVSSAISSAERDNRNNTPAPTSSYSSSSSSDSWGGGQSDTGGGGDAFGGGQDA